MTDLDDILNARRLIWREAGCTVSDETTERDGIPGFESVSRFGDRQFVMADSFVYIDEHPEAKRLRDEATRIEMQDRISADDRRAITELRDRARQIEAGQRKQAAE